MNLPQVQLDLIDALGEQLNKTVVILQNGAPVLLPFVDKTAAILEAYLGGQAGASAVAKVLSGEVNPSGKLAETFPANLDDVPSQPYFPGTTKQVQYREAIWVGYRYFDTTSTQTLFPFGHGLSYTNFTYYHLKLLSGDKTQFNENNSIKLKITITNTGNRAGAEVVQCYIGQKSPSQPRPAKELKAFEKVFLEVGESKEVTFELDYRAFAYWHKEKATWIAESGDYQVHIGSSVNDIRDTATITLETGILAEQPNSALASYFTPAKRDFNDSAFSALLGYDIPAPTPIKPYTVNSTLGDIANEPSGKPLFESMLSMFTQMMGGDKNDSAAEADRLMAEAMVADMPLRNLPVFNIRQYCEEDILILVDSMNSQTRM